MHRVLAVDDNPRNLSIIERALDGAYELVTVTSGTDALELAPRFRPDVVLLDIMMPGIDGYETARRLRRITSVRDTKVIMLSARAHASDRIEGYAAGADDYITKPFDTDELLAKLRVHAKLKSVEEVDRLKSELLYLLAHETRTPLSTILAPCDLLLEEDGLTGPQRSLVEMIRRGGARLLSLVERVSYLSQLKAGLVPESRIALDVRTLIDSAVAACGASTERADIRIACEGGDGLTVHGDALQLERSLAALIENAMRVAPGGGTVRIEALASADWVAVCVQDGGPGIPEHFRDRLFEEFAVADIAHHSKGHGLGLATARTIAERHGGELVLEETGPTGTRFALRLPLPLAAERAA